MIAHAMGAFFHKNLCRMDVNNRALILRHRHGWEESDDADLLIVSAELEIYICREQSPPRPL